MIYLHANHETAEWFRHFRELFLLLLKITEFTMRIL